MNICASDLGGLLEVMSTVLAKGLQIGLLEVRTDRCLLDLHVITLYPVLRKELQGPPVHVQETMKTKSGDKRDAKGRPSPSIRI
jgi:hypothetical protein